MKVCLMIFMFAFSFAQNQCAENTVMNANKSSTDAIMENRNAEVKALERLPDGIEPETKVRKDAEDGSVSTEIVTVEQKLKELGATFRNGKLIDGAGKEIKFYEPFCRGASEGVEADQKARKEKEKGLTELKKKYTAIILYCDPTQVL